MWIFCQNLDFFNLYFNFFLTKDNICFFMFQNKIDCNRAISVENNTLIEFLFQTLVLVKTSIFFKLTYILIWYLESMVLKFDIKD